MERSCRAIDNAPMDSPLNDPPSTPPPRSMSCCMVPLAGGLGVFILAGMLSFPPGGVAMVFASFILGVIGAISSGLVLVAYQDASASGRFQLSLATCLSMMLILSLLLFGDLRGA